MTQHWITASANARVKLALFSPYLGLNVSSNQVLASGQAGGDRVEQGSFFKTINLQPTLNKIPTQQQPEQQTTGGSQRTEITTLAPSPTSASSAQESDANGNPSDPRNQPGTKTSLVTVAPPASSRSNAVPAAGGDGPNQLNSQTLAALLSGLGLASLFAGLGIFVWNKMHRRRLTDLKEVPRLQGADCPFIASSRSSSGFLAHYKILEEPQEPRRRNSEESHLATEAHREFEGIVSEFEVGGEGSIVNGEEPPPYARRWGIPRDNPPDYLQNGER
ncbi:hypothetical protein HDU97_007019 [Phlyctochytrium planicorne]|nr:hypothetical protein HDU97_007019 [Phlyctochytrium planicorne]